MFVLSLHAVVVESNWTNYPDTIDKSLLAYENLFSSEVSTVWESLLNNTDQESALMTISLKQKIIFFKDRFWINDVLHE